MSNQCQCPTAQEMSALRIQLAEADAERIRLLNILLMVDPEVLRQAAEAL